MASENEVVVFTDFDRTMIKQNSPALFFFELFRKRPKTAIRACIKAMHMHGLGGRAFIHAVSEILPENRDAIIKRLVKKFKFNNKWILALRKLIEKYPNIKQVRLVVITRNIEQIPRMFLKANFHVIKSFVGKKIADDVLIIANNASEEAVISGLGFRKEQSITKIINQSRDKGAFLKNKNTIYFGDSREYKELVKVTKLKNIVFFKV